MPSEGALRDGGAAGFHLIETMLWDRDRGVVRGDRHLRRLLRSAAELGFRHDAGAIETLFSHHHASDGPLRLRLTLTQDGETELTEHPFVPVAEGAVWRVVLAATRLNSADRLLAHKTSRRAIYEAARAEFAAGEADEVVLLNERGEICEGAITSVFARFGAGPLVTPPLACGLLAGVLREELLEKGNAVERVISPGDLRGAEALFVGNSLRGLIPARLT